MAETTTSKPDAPVTIENVEQASSNFYWTYKTEAGDFNLQTTIRGILDYKQINAHIKSILETMAHVQELGGIAKSGGKYDQLPVTPMPEVTPVETIVAEMQKEDPLWVPLPEEAKVEPTKIPEVTIFITHMLEVSVDANGKKNFKIVGDPPFHKYGVRVWDDVLTKNAIPISRLEGGKAYPLEGYKATIAVNEKGYKKIGKLEKM
jgi:hypothetical protein